MTTLTTARTNLTDLQSLRLPPFGGEGGYGTEGDVLVNVTADGVDLNVIWAEVAAVIKAWNAERSALTSLMAFNTTDAASAIPQSRSSDSFEEASEFGEPEGIRPPSNYHLMGYTFKDFDLATRWTWKFLRDSTAEQVRAVANYALDADNKLTTGTILERLFDPTQRENNWGHPVFGLFNGDGLQPPAYLGKEFAVPHQHYLVSESAVIDSADLETAVRKVTEHGYGVESNSKLLALMNPAEAEVVSTFKAGVENATGIFAKHDYIPSQGAPAYFSPDEIVGQVAPESYNGLKVQGSYGPVWVIQSDFIPAGYFAVVATYGANSPNNVIGFREHVQRQYQGLRTIPGLQPGYPLAGAYFQRSFGVGVRRRGQACVTQIAVAGEYTVPVIPK
ncbi:MULTISPECIES: hypothetical protein [Mycobacterium]|uniref:Uncharacterized protein n=1 Tax=Mycobacterium kiyosense TaxID=2871094 RepID=A0A9P3Q5M9_9MYCO|nr:MULTISPECIES: hypothetical protein [Mycobacterium]BDE15151.1 hypothetical protein MKCMC460_40110 [Mycobacterium sp. 20KCMC460]GLB81634.1 hypothetical protein SRL2020028_08900 [Mycobacterium kiyosense]GLB87587.1 hypothetical protein SRL2020130_04040 [Mycobacterium kiyosense]GLB94214.1 hypothetical protein SRL2020226_09900 [Mycobacterium kiyosense]GLC01715.1 hypothetical protein SRL2020400_23060 [Mycobacterium kiyosense]